MWRYDARGARYFNAGGRYSLKWAIDKIRWRAFGALPTIRARPEGPLIGRLRMVVCPVEGLGGVAIGGARRSRRLLIDAVLTFNVRSRNVGFITNS